MPFAGVESPIQVSDRRVVSDKIEHEASGGKSMSDGTGLPGIVDDAISAQGERDRWRAVTSLTAPL
jgi:hypothetical protein